MKKSIHHFYQPDQYSCVQTAAAMLLSYFGVNKTPQDILDEIPVRSWPGKDEPAGTPNQDIASYFCSLGFETEIISADGWVTDLAWAGKTTEFIKARLEKASGALTAPVIGREGTELYIQAYLDFIKARGRISVVSAITSDLLKHHLANGPFI